MAQFLTTLETRCHPTDDGLYCLTAPLVFESDMLERAITVPAGFWCDQASIPRIPIVFMLWGNRAHHEGTLHDAAYRVDFKPPLTFMQANRLFLEALRSRGDEIITQTTGIKWQWVRIKRRAMEKALFAGVCVGGWASYHKKTMDWKPKDVKRQELRATIQDMLKARKGKK